MSVSAGFREYVQEQLEQVTPVRLRRMFGGVGVYSQGFFFALLDNDTLFFKVDESNRSDYQARGMRQFRPFGDDRMSLSYYELPAEILEDPESLRSWVRKSVAAAMRKSAQKRAPRKTTPSGRSRGKKPAIRRMRADADGGIGIASRKNAPPGQGKPKNRSGTKRPGGGAGRRGRTTNVR